MSQRDGGDEGIVTSLWLVSGRCRKRVANIETQIRKQERISIIVNGIQIDYRSEYICTSIQHTAVKVIACRKCVQNAAKRDT